MENLIVYENPQFGKIRTLNIDGEPWFVANDVCRVLNIKNSRDAISRLDYDEKNTVTISDGNRGNSNVNIVSEPGLYLLIFASRKPEAHAFRRWIAHEVIPSIRKTGHYSAVENDEITISQKTLALIIGTTVAECIKQFPAFHHPTEFSDETKEPQNLPSDMKGRYCKHLRAFMQENGMCQRDLSRALNIRPATIHNWWYGLTVPRPSRQILIAELFNVSPSDFWEE